MVIEKKIQAARCPECNNPILLAVIENMSKDSRKEFAKLLKKGFIIDTVSVDEARTANMCLDKNHWSKN
jgi:hypothetical protein